MTYRVKLTKKASKYLNSLGPKYKERINKNLKNLIAYYEGKEVPVPDVRKLHGDYQGLLRLRIGDIRIIFKLEHNNFIIIVIDIAARGDVYK